MTLLIGTISKSHIVITADGLSRVNPTSGVGIGSDAFQKVFPVPAVKGKVKVYQFRELKSVPPTPILVVL